MAFNYCPPLLDELTYVLLRDDKVRRAWLDLDLDVMLCPAFAFPAPQVEVVRELTGAHRSTSIFNLLDYPAGVLPVTRVTAADLAISYDPGTDNPVLAAASRR